MVRLVLIATLVACQGGVGDKPAQGGAGTGSAPAPIDARIGFGSGADDERQAAHVNRVLNRAETLLEQTQTTQLAVHSDLLRRGFRDRLTLLAEQVTITTPAHTESENRA